MTKHGIVLAADDRGAYAQVRSNNLVKLFPINGCVVAATGISATDTILVELQKSGTLPKTLYPELLADRLGKGADKYCKKYNLYDEPQLVLSFMVAGFNNGGEPEIRHLLNGTKFANMITASPSLHKYGAGRSDGDVSGTASALSYWESVISHVVWQDVEEEVARALLVFFIRQVAYADLNVGEVCQTCILLPTTESPEIISSKDIPDLDPHVAALTEWFRGPCLNEILPGKLSEILGP